MKEWIPLLQTAIWPIFIIVVIWKFYPKILLLFDTIIKRIAEGSSFNTGLFGIGEKPKYESPDTSEGELNKKAKGQLEENKRLFDKIAILGANVMKLNNAIIALAKKTTNPNYY